MITARGILDRSIQLLTYDPWHVARIWLPAFLAFLMLTCVEMLTLVMATEAGGAAPGLSVYPPLMIVMLLAAVMLVPWSAVAFHRYVLRDEVDPGLVPPLGKIFGYIWRSLLIGFLVLLPVLVLIFASAAAGGLALLLLASLAGSLLSSWLFLRIGLVLPAISVDSPMGFVESMRVTKPVNNAIIALALILSVIDVIASLVPLGLLGEVVRAIIWLIEIAVLTTLYGLLVEGRPMETL